MGAAHAIAVVAPRHAVGPAIGGAETLLRALALRLAAAGRKVRLLTTCATDHVSWENVRTPGVVRDGPLEVEHFPVAPRDAARFHEIQREISRGARLPRELEEQWLANGVRSPALCEHLRTGGYDRVLAGPYLFGLTVEVARAVPDRLLLVPCLHDEPFAYTAPIREMFATVRGCLFNSGPEQELAERLYALERRRGRVVGMGIEPFETDPSAFAARRGLEAPFLLYSGRREAGKGTPLLIEYVRTFRERVGRDVRLVLTGSGPVDPAPFVLDLGVVEEQVKREAMAAATVFAHPSCLESLGIVVLESFMARTPALVNAGSEVLRWQCARSGGGLWFRHYPDFEACLERLLADEPLRRRLGAHGRRYVEMEYSWTAVERRLWEALEAL